MSAISDALQQEWNEFLVATNAGKRTVSENWRRANPGEWQKLQAYRVGGSRPVLATSFGRQMVEHVDAWHLAGSAPPPPPTVVYPSTSRYPAEVI